MGISRLYGIPLSTTLPHKHTLPLGTSCACKHLSQLYKHAITVHTPNNTALNPYFLYVRLIHYCPPGGFSVCLNCSVPGLTRPPGVTPRCICTWGSSHKQNCTSSRCTGQNGGCWLCWGVGVIILVAGVSGTSMVFWHGGYIHLMVFSLVPTLLPSLKRPSFIAFLMFLALLTVTFP